ncbi:hypothetical protein PsAD2_00975 [Pseudovibrio axinellae]|uniref:Uncharacterized protein n=1 Tax=Pseudovibrio axinellae TaxID=989403 RepID=A0A166AF14_9HYPH|nr:hypothetical protein PsAD2_00975 [Pseudovibrio axinellae]SEP80220.1 hypothetical protein SAMN05421798_101426 [Pseudovibrio axinellae]
MTSALKRRDSRTDAILLPDGGSKLFRKNRCFAKREEHGQRVCIKHANNFPMANLLDASREANLEPSQIGEAIDAMFC